MLFKATVVSFKTFEVFITEDSNLLCWNDELLRKPLM